ncbi:hypothetical protein [Caloranaerobacter sp. DY30410]|uniref:hypothetical protein n=1 Tax=Caloranaerobacter sp. DY30410 TaxID=3238305 RepID=UPI003D02318B
MDKTWIMQTLMMLGIGTIAYFVKDLKKSIESKIEDNQTRIKLNADKIEELEKSFNDYKAKVPLLYVQKDDFIRAVSNLDKKLDKIYDVIVQKGSE